MARVQFVETVLIPGGVGGSLIPVKGVAATPYSINSDGTEGSQATTYIDRTSMTQPDSLATDESGTVSFWLDPGDYNVHLDDQQSPFRIRPYIRGFTAPVIDTNQLVVAAQNLIQFAGDTKYSLQTGDHGLKADGTYEWLLVTSDPDGGGRKIDHALYPGIYILLGSPVPDSQGMIRLPNVSGRTLIAAGTATGLTRRNLLDLVGEESHLLAQLESGLRTHNHVDSGHSHSDSGHSHPLVDPGHNHDIHRTGTDTPVGATSGVFSLQENSGTFYTRTQSKITSISMQNASANIQNGSANIQPVQGVDATNAHNNMQPSSCLNFFVKS